MATLMEKLKQTLGGVGAQPTGDEEQRQVRQLLAAREGIVAPAPLGGGRSVAESVARQQTTTELGKVGQAAQLLSTGQQQQQQEIAQRQRGQEAEIAGQRRSNQLQFAIQTDRILQDLAQNKDKLSVLERGEKMEFVSTLLRQQSKQYVDDLQREGERQRLTDEISFNEALAQDIFDENIALVKTKIANQELRDVSDREWNQYLASISISDAIAQATDSARQSTREAVVGGVTELAKAGIDAYSTQQEGGFDSGYQDYLKRLGPGEKAPSYNQYQQAQKSERG